MDFDPQSLIGITIEDADILVKKHGVRLRVTHKDGRPGIVTADWRTDRINVKVETVGPRVIITEISGVG